MEPQGAKRAASGYAAVGGGQARGLREYVSTRVTAWYAYVNSLLSTIDTVVAQVTFSCS